MPWQELTLSSQALAGNPLGDPHDRPLFVWAPSDTSRRYPTVYVLHAHMRSARSWFNVTPFETSYPEDVEALQPEAVVVLVDGWTSVGGSQWIDSAGIGRYGTYLCEEVVPFVDERFPTLPEPRRRALQGKSSGGYGALVTAVARPDLFGAVAAHAPDALFEVTIARGFAPAARALRDRYDGSPARFWESFTSLQSSDDALLVELLVVGARVLATGSCRSRSTTRRSFPDVWARWLEHDPVRIVSEQRESACELACVWLDAGNADEYFLDLGATALQRGLVEAGVADERLHFELYEGRHGGARHRYPLSLAWLVRGSLEQQLKGATAVPGTKPPGARHQVPGTRTLRRHGRCQAPLRRVARGAKAVPGTATSCRSLARARPLEQLVVRLGEAELAVERGACSSCAAATRAGERAVVDHLAHERLTEAAAAELRQDVDVREVGERDAVADRPAEADLALAVVEADDARRVPHQALLDVERPTRGPVALVAEVAVHLDEVDAFLVVVELEPVAQVAARHAETVRRRNPPCSS